MNECVQHNKIYMGSQFTVWLFELTGGAAAHSVSTEMSNALPDYLQLYIITHCILHEHINTRNDLVN